MSSLQSTHLHFSIRAPQIIPIQHHRIIKVLCQQLRQREPQRIRCCGRTNHTRLWQSQSNPVFANGDFPFRTRTTDLLNGKQCLVLPICVIAEVELTTPGIERSKFNTALLGEHSRSEEHTSE